MATPDFVDTPPASLSANSWHELSKSDYAKVIFCDMFHDPDSFSIGCRFQITDNVHEDPCDYVGLFRVGYDNLSQCLVSKMLSETECEEDGKLLRCVFTRDELPSLDDGFYQFLYITRDIEVCGASMPFEIKQSVGKEDSSDEDVIADKTDGDFLVVRSLWMEKNNNLQLIVDNLSDKLRDMSEELSKVTEEKSKICQENSDVIASLQKEVCDLKKYKTIEKSRMTKMNEAVEKMTKQIEKEATEKAALLTTIDKLSDDKDQLHKIIKGKDSAFVQQITLLGHDTNTILAQLEDSKVMIRALEDSKLLALKEMNNLTKLLSEHKKMLQDVISENSALKLKLEDEQSFVKKHKKMLQEVICENTALKCKLEDEQASVQKHKKMVQEGLCENTALKLKLKDAQASAQKDRMVLEEVKCENVSLRIKLDEEKANVQRHKKIWQEGECETSALKLKSEYELASEQPSSIEAVLQEHRVMVRKMMCEKAALKLMLEDEKASVRKSMKVPQEVKNEDPALKFKLHDQASVPKQREKTTKLNTVEDLKTQAERICSFHKEKIETSRKSIAIEKVHLELKKILQKEVEDKENPNFNTGITENTEGFSGFKDSLQLQPIVKTEDKSMISVPEAHEIAKNVFQMMKSEKWGLKYLMESGTAPAEKIKAIVQEIKRRKALNAQLEDLKESTKMRIKESSILNTKGIAENPEGLFGFKNSHQKLQPIVMAEDKPKAAIEAEGKGAMNSIPEDNEISRRIIEELKVQVFTLMKNTDIKCAYCRRIDMDSSEIKDLKKKLEEKSEENKKMSVQICDLQSNCKKWDAEVIPLKSHISVLLSQLKEKETLLSQLKKDCIKKDAVIEYLSKEKQQFLNTESALHADLFETRDRLNEAADLYRKQYIEIEKLKKKLRKNQHASQKDGSISRSSSVISQCSLQNGNPDNIKAQDCPTNCPTENHPDGWFSANQNISDSDTGEHVIGEAKIQNAVALKQFLFERVHTSGCQDAIDKTDCTSSSSFIESIVSIEEGKAMESPNLHQMIEQNLAKLSACKSMEAKVEDTEFVQCVICEKPIGNVGNYTDAMVQHLEVEHMQQMCPVCGRLFDMTLPEKYLAYHVDDHFES